MTVEQDWRSALRDSAFFLLIVPDRQYPHTVREQLEYAISLGKPLLFIHLDTRLTHPDIVRAFAYYKGPKLRMRFRGPDLSTRELDARAGEFLAFFAENGLEPGDALNVISSCVDHRGRLSK